MQDAPDFSGIPAPQLRRRWLIYSAVLLAVSSPVYALWIGPFVVTTMQFSYKPIFIPTGFWAPLGMLFPSLAIGLLITLATLNPLPFRTLFQPTRARLIGALVLFAIFPVAVLGIVPATMGFFALGQLGDVFLAPDEVNLPLFLVLQFGLGFCYVVACLLSSGIPHRGRRFLSYSVLWWTGYATTFAAGTALRFQL